MWKQQKQGKRNNELPEGLRQLVRGKQAAQWTQAEAKKLRLLWLQNVYAGARAVLDPIAAEKAPLEKEKSDISKRTPVTFIMADLPQPRDSFVMVRGQYNNPGARVDRNVPAFLPALPARPADRDYNRLDLAN